MRQQAVDSGSTTRCMDGSFVLADCKGVEDGHKNASTDAEDRPEERIAFGVSKV